MKEVISDIQRWRRAGRRVAVARVVGLEGSGPRDPGATMAVNELGEVAGSVSGGCVEGAVVAESLAALAAGAPRRCTFGYSDEEAFSVGLTCGGTIHVLVTPEVPSVYDPLREALEAERPVVLATVVETEAVTAAGTEAVTAVGTDAMGALPVLGADLLVPADGPMQGSLGGAELDEVVRRDALGALAGGLSATRHYGRRGEARMREVGVFLEVFAAPPHMVVLGAVDFTAALVKVAKVLGYRVTVCDARPAFATRTRFPLADEIVADQPARYLASIRDVLGPRDAVCVLTHDTKFDVPAITAALATNVGYLGAMGSRRTHSDRLERLRRSNIDQSELDRVMAPIGLDIGARTPEETAVAICAEIIAMRTGRPAPSLRDRTGPVHHPTSSPQPAAL